jgi:hypothetical protein
MLAINLAGSPARAMPGIEAEIACLAQTIYFEARGEPNIGQFAVGHVVMNRAADSRFPRRVCDVVFQRQIEPGGTCEFSWTCDALSDVPTDMKAWRPSMAIARSVYFGRSRDPTNAALWYHADYVAPAWTSALGPGRRIGHHIFYREPDGLSGGSTTTAQIRSWSPKSATSFSSAIQQISQSFGASGLAISLLVYAKDPRGRSVRINGAVYREGDSVTSNLTVESITMDDVVLRHGDARIRLNP